MSRISKSSVVYQIFLRSFTLDGTLRAAEKMLPHIAGLGVDIVYLCPVNLSDDDPSEEHWSDRHKKSQIRNPQNPYRMKDYFAIDPEYGTVSDLKAFISTAHSLGLRVLLDLVYYHCGPAAVFIPEHPDYVKRQKDGTFKNGSYHFPELNFESPALREYLWRNMEYYVRELNVDGYRCDVAGLVPIDFWEEGRRRIDAVKPNLLMISESWGDAATAQRSAFDVNYSEMTNQLHDILKGSKGAESFRAAWEQEHAGAMSGARYLITFDNHDLTNDDYDARPECDGRSRRVDAALAVMFTLDGIPFIYSGREFADGRRHSIYANRLYGKNLVVDWGRALTPEGQERMRLLRQLISLRQESDVLQNGDVVWLDHDQPASVIAFIRRTSQKQIVVIANLGMSAVDVTLQSPVAGIDGSLHLDSGEYLIK